MKISSMRTRTPALPFPAVAAPDMGERFPETRTVEARPPGSAAWAVCAWDLGLMLSVASRDIFQGLVHQFSFDLFEGFTLGLGQLEFDEHKSRHANRGVKPERPRRTQLRIQNGKGIRQD